MNHFTQGKYFEGMTDMILEKEQTVSKARIPVSQHDYYESCEQGDCGGTCLYCTLTICKNCGGTEGSLTTECSNEILSFEMEKRVYHGEIDYRCGKWHEGLRNRVMYSDPNEIIKNESLYLNWLRKRPFLDLERIVTAKKLVSDSKEYLKNKRKGDGY